MVSLGLIWSHFVSHGLTWPHSISLVGVSHFLTREKGKLPGAKREKGKGRYPVFDPNLTRHPDRAHARMTRNVTFSRLVSHPQLPMHTLTSFFPHRHRSVLAEALPPLLQREGPAFNAKKKTRRYVLSALNQTIKRARTVWLQTCSDCCVNQVLSLMAPQVHAKVKSESERY